MTNIYVMARASGEPRASGEVIAGRWQRQARKRNNSPGLLRANRAGPAPEASGEDKTGEKKSEPLIMRKYWCGDAHLSYHSLRNFFIQQKHGVTMLQSLAQNNKGEKEKDMKPCRRPFSRRVQ